MRKIVTSLLIIGICVVFINEYKKSKKTKVKLNKD